jgi:uncharacterized Fe-S center protein
LLNLAILSTLFEGKQEIRHMDFAGGNVGEKGISAFPKIKEMKCTGCGICSLLCPCNAISCFGGANIEKEKCNGCLVCSQFCPMGAIEVNQEVVR